jgi:type IV pilus assembly protein PilV
MNRHRNEGFLLIEVLIALVILAFGLLALARAMATATLDELESFQRSQAMVIAQEMVERINANRKEALSYVGSYAAPPVIQDCSLEATLLLRDQCEFRNHLMGSGTRDAGKAIGSAIAARACITEASPGSNAYIVAVAWQGLKSTEAPDSACGEEEFDREDNRRVFSTVLRIATLGA